MLTRTLPQPLNILIKAGVGELLPVSLLAAVVVVVVVDFYYSDMPETYIFDCKVQKCL